jgi:hypothetical protein
MPRIRAHSARPSNSQQVSDVAVAALGVPSEGAEKEARSPNCEKRARNVAEGRTDGQHLFDQIEQRQGDDLIEVHDAAKEQDCHQAPTTTETVDAVVSPHLKGSRVALLPMMHQETHWASAMLEAGLLQRGELVGARKHQDKARENLAHAIHHHRRKDADAFKSPLHACGDRTKHRPNQKVAGGERCGWKKVSTRANSLGRFPVDPCVDQNYRRSTWKHHGDHHDPPHYEHHSRILGCPFNRH